MARMAVRGKFALFIDCHIEHVGLTPDFALGHNAHNSQKRSRFRMNRALPPMMRSDSARNRSTTGRRSE